MDIVRTYQLTKRYDSRTVVDAINLQVPEGSVYGFVMSLDLGDGSVSGHW